MARPAHPEMRDVRPRVLLLSGAGLLVFLGLSAIALHLIFNTRQYWPLSAAARNESETNPALQWSPATDLAAFRKQEDADLDKLGWVDRATGIARIPIEDAMKVIVAQGLPGWTRQVVSAGQDCALLKQQVPRAPQLSKCNLATGQTPPVEDARPQDHAAPASGVRP